VQSFSHSSGNVLHPDPPEKLGAKSEYLKIVPTEVAHFGLSHFDAHPKVDTIMINK
jgi:hypothetical protein